MITEKMKIHEALAELKVIGERITKEIDSTTFVTTNKHSNLKINGETISDFSAKVNSAYQKINDLIKRREAIKRQIVQSNAETMVDINGKKMSVAEAIEYRNTGIAFKERLLSVMAYQYNNAIKRMTIENGENLEEKANKHIISLYGSDKKDAVDAATIEETRKSYIEIHTTDLIDPLSIAEEIEKLKDEIDKFKVKVDSVLSISNAVTEITIEY